jgi:hypothetical protein
MQIGKALSFIQTMKGIRSSHEISESIATLRALNIEIRDIDQADALSGPGG